MTVLVHLPCTKQARTQTR